MGDAVWIRVNVLIKAGVAIGNGAVIALGSVVVIDVKAYAITGGNLAIAYQVSVWWRYSSEN